MGPNCCCEADNCGFMAGVVSDCVYNMENAINSQFQCNAALDEPAPTEPAQTPTEPAQAPTEPAQAPTEPAQAPTEPAQAPSATSGASTIAVHAALAVVATGGLVLFCLK